MKIQIRAVDIAWKGGDKTIYKILTELGEEHKTWDDTLGNAASGSEFEVEEYDCKTSRGVNKFIKLSGKDEKPGQSPKVHGGGGKNESFAMSYAKDIVISRGANMSYNEVRNWLFSMYYDILGVLNGDLAVEYDSPVDVDVPKNVGSEEPPF